MLKTFVEIGQEIGSLVQEKNDSYGNSFIKSGEVMRILYPDGIAPDQMKDALLVVRIIDKLFRIASDRHAFGESPFKDIAGYGICGTFAAQGEKYHSIGDVIAHLEKQIQHYRTELADAKEYARELRRSV